MGSPLPFCLLPNQVEAVYSRTQKGPLGYGSRARILPCVKPLNGFKQGGDLARFLSFRAINGSIVSSLLLKLLLQSCLLVAGVERVTTEESGARDSSWRGPGEISLHPHRIHP